MSRGEPAGAPVVPGVRRGVGCGQRDRWWEWGGVGVLECCGGMGREGGTKGEGGVTGYGEAWSDGERHL